MDDKKALELGYLEDKKITLKPVPKGANMGITDKAHINYFQIENGSTFFSLPRTQRGDLVEVFKSEQEREFFEKRLGLNLNVSMPGNFFETFDVKVTKDYSLLYKGITYDMANPMDNLRVRVLAKNPPIAPSWDERNDRIEYKWALVDQSKIEKEAEVEYDASVEFGMFLGKLGTELDKKKNVLKVYFNTINSSKKVNEESTEQMIKAEFQSIAKDLESKKKFLEIVTSPLFDSKVLVLEAIECGIISKDGNNQYVFTGEDTTYTFDGISKYIKELEESQDDEFFLIKDRVKKQKQGK